MKNLLKRSSLVVLLLSLIIFLRSHQAPKPFSLSRLLQFKSGDHIVAFESNKVFLTGLDHALTIRFVGGRDQEPIPEGEVGTTKLNKVSYQQVWPGVDVVYTGGPEKIAESVYYLRAGSDPGSIRLEYNVPTKIEDKELQLKFSNGYMSESRPVAWQEINGQKIYREAEFKKYLDDTIGFEVQEFDKTKPLLIDPGYAWHAFYGISNLSQPDAAWAVAVDLIGNIYITGDSFDTWNGPNGETPRYFGGGGKELTFVLKLNSAGQYQWHTFYGWRYANSGSYCSSSAFILYSGFGRGIGVDPNGNVYVAGCGDVSWSGPSGQAPLHAFSGPTKSAEVLVLKLNNSGDYQWHTFYGGAQQVIGYAIAVDSSGNSYVTGTSWGTWNGNSGATPLHPYSGNTSLYVLKLNTNGVYQWHTFYGPSLNTSTGYGIALDASGSNIYVTGDSGDTWQGGTISYPVSPLNAHTTGGSDMYLLKLRALDGTYMWHTFYGVNGTSNVGYAISTFGDQSVYVTGIATGTWNGPGVAPINPYSGGFDGFLLKLNNSGVYQWHTFFGSSSGDDSGQAIAVDSHENVYLAARSTATFTGPLGQAPLSPYSGNKDFLVMKFNNAGAYQWHTFHGSANEDWPWGIAVDPRGEVTTVGYSIGTWNGPDNQAPLSPYVGGYDAVIVHDSFLNTISGNVGIAGATLSYLDISPRTAIADSSGNYSLQVSSQWSGSVTPSLVGYTFIPSSRDYSTLTTNQTNQNYTANLAPISPTPTISATSTPIGISLNFTSKGSQDGWLLASSATNKTGGSVNANQKTFQLGYDKFRKQYKAILSFDTHTIPLNSKIVAASLRIKQSGSIVGKNPFDALGPLQIDIKKGIFGGKANLEPADFNSKPSATNVGTFNNKPSSGWYTATLNSAGLASINRAGVTQFRLHFKKGSNKNSKANIVKFVSGNASSGQPTLVINYL